MSKPSIKNTEIRSQAHEMWAEGAEDDPCDARDIEELLNEHGYTGNMFDMFFDGMQSVWRWSCEIKKLTS